MHLPLEEIACRLMRCPAAPYHESLVIAEVLAICRETGLRAEFDAFGNLLVRTKRSSSVSPLVLAAHLDHPGFVCRNGIWEFLGGVGDVYFQEGVPVLLQPGNTRAFLGKRLSDRKRQFELRVAAEPIAQPTFAVWDLPAFKLGEGRVTGRACDDLIGAATILYVLAALKRQKSRADVIGVLSRAEEVGFHGALALAGAKALPNRSLIISLETSRELPPVQMGNGVIVRVGDRASVFDPAATRFLTEVATDLTKTPSGFHFQRALMSGGTCEATAYQEYGYRCAAVCVALGNYHNCGADLKIVPEFVSLADAESMAALLESCADRFKEFRQITARLPKRLAEYHAIARRELRKHSIQPVPKKGPAKRQVGLR